MFVFLNCFHNYFEYFFNVSSTLFPLSFQLWYETKRDVNAGAEIVVDARSKTPFDIGENFMGSGGAAVGEHSVMAAACAAAAVKSGANNNNNSSKSNNNNTSGNSLQLISGDDRSDRDNGEYNKDCWEKEKDLQAVWLMLLQLAVAERGRGEGREGDVSKCA